MTPTPSKSASERAALVREAREESREWATFADLAQTMGALVAERETGTIDIAGTADLLHRLATALEAADADTKRLDWLEAREHTLLIRDLWQPPERGAHVTQLDLESGYADNTLGVSATFREAIDAARAAEETGR